MKKYIITHENFNGELEFRYDPAGLVYNVDVRAELTIPQAQFIFQTMPVEAATLPAWAQTNGFEAKEIPADLSFASWWAMWCNAGGVQANKKRAQALYEKLSKANQVKAIWSLKSYKRFLQRCTWISPQYPDTYLSHRKPGYENDWDKM